MDLKSVLEDKALISKLSREFELLKRSGGGSTTTTKRSRPSSSNLLHLHVLFPAPRNAPTADLDYNVWIRDRLQQAAAAKLAAAAVAEHGAAAGAHAEEPELEVTSSLRRPQPLAGFSPAHFSRTGATTHRAADASDPADEAEEQFVSDIAAPPAPPAATTAAAEEKPLLQASAPPACFHPSLSCTSKPPQIYDLDRASRANVACPLLSTGLGPLPCDSSLSYDAGASGRAQRHDT